MNYKKPTLWIIIAAVVICAVVAVCFLTNPNTDIDEKLSVFIDCQIADHFQTEQSEENACCVNWKVLGTEKHGSVTNVYMWVRYDEYCKEDRGIKQVTSAYEPTLITVKREAGEYQLIEYWEPKAGALRESSIREKFPEHLQDEALDPQRYFEEQFDANAKMALEHLFNVVSGENTTEQLLDKAIIIIDNKTGKVVYNGSSSVSLIDDNKTENSEQLGNTKVFIYQGTGFGGGNFFIKIYDDGTFTYQQGSASNYYGVGKWSLHGDMLCLKDDISSYTFVNYFKVVENTLVFQAENSTNFMYVHLSDGEKFVKTDV